MNSTSKLSINAYKTLLKAYPIRFQNEYAGLMLQVFVDKYLEVNKGKGPIRSFLFWVDIFVDALFTIPEEHLSNWSPNMHDRFDKVRSILWVGLVIPFLFAFGNIGFYNLGIQPVFGGLVSGFGAVQDAGLGWLLNIILIGDPILVVLLALPKIIDLNINPDGGGVTAITLKKVPAMQYIALAVGGLLLLTFGAYLVIENL